MLASRAPADDFRAFADPLRLRLLHLLRQGELCVGDLVGALEVRQPAASRHLAYLRRAKLVQSRWKGPWRFYSLAPAPRALQRHLLEALPIFRRSMPLFRDDLVRLRALRKSGGCCPGEPREKQ
jgi:ArsR family transcriptional regulator